MRKRLARRPRRARLSARQFQRWKGGGWALRRGTDTVTHQAAHHAVEMIATRLILAGGSSPARQPGSEALNQTRHY
jgi:hypothetical protein